MFFLTSGMLLAAPWSAYENSRFGYRMIVPEGLEVVARAEDGSGATWQTGTVRVQVYGANNPYKISAERWFANVRKAAGDRIVDERKSNALDEHAWQEILYLKDGRRFHRKTFVGEGSVNTVEVSYAYRLRETKQPIGQKVINSLRPGDLSLTH
jgi:hypothetical protein